MIETHTHCAVCKTDTRLGAEIHCPLCHTNYPKGDQHTCRVLDEAVSDAIEPSTIEQRFTQARVTFGTGENAEKQIPLGARDWSEVKPVEVPSGE